MRPFISPVIHGQEEIAALRLYFLPIIKLSTDEEAWLEAHPVIRVHNEMRGPPFNFNIKDKPTGYSIDYMNLLAEKLGIRVEYITGPSWNDFLGMIKEKKLDVMLNIVNTEQRRSYMLFTDNYLDMPNGIYVREGSQPFSSLSELKGLRLTLSKGVFEQELLEKYYPDINLHQVKDSFEMLEALSNGKSDAMIGEMAVMNYLMRTHAYTNIKMTGTVNDKRFDNILNLGVRKDWPILRNILQKGMNAITFDETRELQERWVVISKAKSWAEQNLSAEEQKWLARNPVLHLGYDNDWPPVEYTDKNGQYQGISAEYMALAAKYLGVIVKPADPQSWSATIKAAKSGQVDILPSVTPTPQRKAYLNFTNPYLSFPMVIVTGLDYLYISDLRMLAGKKVAVVEGYASQDLLTIDYPKLSQVSVKNIEAGLNAVRHGDADVFIGGLIPVSHIMSREGIPGLKISGEASLKFDLAIGISKNQPLLKGIIQKVLDSISEEKRNEIFNRWVSIRYERGFDYSMFWKIIIPILFVVILVVFWNRKLKIEVAQRKMAESNLRETMVDLKTARKEAETATQTKSDFLANMSHEIRTPMNAIIGMSHLCLGTKLNPQQQNYIGMVHKSAQLLLGIINSILDFSKIEAGRLELESIPFRMDEVLKNLSNMVSIKAQEKGLEILFDVDPKIPIHLIGDPLRLGQILLNLTGNALKFTESGEIIVMIRPVQITEELVELEVTVKDTGIGMTNDQQLKLFQSFSQADASTTRKFGGTGFGLAISKHLVQLMKGRIWVQSEPGKGSSFYFTVVLGQDSRDEGEGELQSELPINLEKLKALETIKGAQVLLVEDNTINQLVAKDLLTQAGLRVTIAENGKQAVEMVGETAFDVLLMDIQMPEMDGFEATRIIRSSKSIVQPPIIAMTANAMVGDRKRCLAAGMDDHVAKPIEPEILFETLIKWIPAFEREPAIFQAPQEITPEEFPDQTAGLLSNLVGIDIPTVLGRTGENRKLYITLLKYFVKDHGNDDQVIIDAVRQDDIILAHRTAHTLKGVARGIGALELYDIGQRLETALREKLAALMEELQQLAKEIDPDVDRKAEEISQLINLHDGRYEALGNTLVDQAGNLDFEESLETLKQLRDAIEKDDLSQVMG